jgi:hypothetical protein
MQDQPVVSHDPRWGSARSVVISTSLHKYNLIATIFRMAGRPPKANGQLKAKDLRIPVTDDQKSLIVRAMELSGQEIAGWARPLLVAAAQAIVESSQKTKKK